MAVVTLYHPKLATTVTVPEEAVPVLEKSGWTTKVPKSHDESKEA